MLHTVIIIMLSIHREERLVYLSEVLTFLPYQIHISLCLYAHHTYI